MPLTKGKSKRVIAANTRHLIAKGYAPKQAYAIANKEAGTSRPKRRKRRK